jgi:lipoprotein signal peptidase
LSPSSPPSTSARRKLVVTLTTVGLVLLLDRVTKALAASRLMPGGERDALGIVPGHLSLRWSTNDAGFLGFLGDLPVAGRPWLFRLATVLVGALVIALIARTRRPDEAAPLALFLAGVAGNGYDRFVHGSVIDFAQLTIARGGAPIAFNIADVATAAGLIWVAASTLFGRRERPGGGSSEKARAAA